MTAERLIAERGLDSVTISEVAREAGVDGSAIHYHFGSKRELIVAILQFRAEQLSERRHVLLEELRANGTLTLRDLAEVLIFSVVEVVQEDPDSGYHFPGLLAAISGHPQLTQTQGEILGAQSTEFMEALQEAAPHLPDDVLRVRLSFAKQVVNNVLGNMAPGQQACIRRHSGDDHDAVIVNLVDYIEAGFAGPTSL